jgi:multidrug efflux pump subunit AcrB
MKKIISFFIKYPVAVNVSMIAIVLIGLISSQSLTSSFFPLEDTKIINISVVYPGASPAEIEEGVILKIEDNLRGLVGIDRFTSKSQENAGTITVEAEEGVDINVVLADVKNAVDRVPSFPVDMEPPIIAKQENRNQAITFAIWGEGVPLRTLKEISRKVESDLRALPNISQVAVTGFPDEEIEIAVRENDLRAYDLTFQEVAVAVRNANILTTGGNIKTDTEEYLIRANNRAYYGDELDYLIVKASGSGQVVRLKDVAQVRDKFSEIPDRVSYNGSPAVQFSISTTNNEDILEANTNAKKYVEKFNSENTSVQASVTADNSIALRDRQDLLVENGAIGIFLVLLLLSLFLKPSIALWVAVGLR